MRGWINADESTAIVSFWDTYCSHPRHTDIVDGQALCVDCGDVVEPFITQRGLERMAALIERDYGYAGRHSLACVPTPDGWCCATDCTMRRP